jgi:hypothetical protein
MATFDVTTVAGSSDGDLDGVNGVSAKFSSPGGIGIAADGSFAIVADTMNHKLKKLDLTGNHEVTTVAGSGIAATGNDDAVGLLARLDQPTGCDVSRNGCFAVFTEQFSARVRTMTLKAGCAAPFDTEGEVKLLAGSYGYKGSADGVGAAAYFNQPQQIAIYPSGSIAVVADTMNHRVRKIYIGHDHPYLRNIQDPGGWSHGEVLTLAGSSGGSLDGSHNTARFYEPAGLDFSPTYDFVLVADTGNNQIRRVDMMDGWTTTLTGSASAPASSTDGVGEDALFVGPSDVAVASDSSWALVVGKTNRLIRRLVLRLPFPSAVPTTSPTAAPTADPTTAPTTAPTAAPTESPTDAPTVAPTSSPTNFPTFIQERADYIEPDPSGTTALGSPAEAGGKFVLFGLLMCPFCCMCRIRKMRKKYKAKVHAAFMSLGEGRSVDPAEEGAADKPTKGLEDDDGMPLTSGKQLSEIVSFEDQQLRPMQFLQIFRAATHRKQGVALRHLKLPQGTVNLDIALSEQEVATVVAMLHRSHKPASEPGANVGRAHHHKHKHPKRHKGPRNSVLGTVNEPGGPPEAMLGVENGTSTKNTVGKGGTGKQVAAPIAAAAGALSPSRRLLALMSPKRVGVAKSSIPRGSLQVSPEVGNAQGVKNGQAVEGHVAGGEIMAENGQLRRESGGGRHHHHHLIRHHGSKSLHHIETNIDTLLFRGNIENHLGSRSEKVKLQAGLDRYSIVDRHIGNAGVTIFSAFLPLAGSSLCSINLQGNDIGPKGVEALVEGLDRGQIMKHLHYLDLSNNKLGVGGAKAMVRLLRGYTHGSRCEASPLFPIQSRSTAALV